MIHNKPTPADLSCSDCTEYIKPVGCTALECPYLAERIEAGVVGYQEILANTFPFHKVLMFRLQRLIKYFSGTMWRDDSHKQRFHLAATCCDYQCATNTYYAALYLLTADEPLYKRCSRCFMRTCETSRVVMCIENIDIQGISPLDYTLYSYARKLNAGETDFSVTELIDGWSVPHEVFRYIVNAVMIAKHGVAVLNITKTTTEMIETEDAEDGSIQS